jgi:anti-sigma factor RsiW
MTPCDKIQENLAAEALDIGANAEVAAHLEACSACRSEADDFRRLAASLQDLEIDDPGELFFAAQRKHIRETLNKEFPVRKAPAWRPALALAAAAVLLFIGFSTWQGRVTNPNLAWSTAMLVFAEGQGSATGSGILELETLSPQQLEGLAQNMEKSILGNNGDEFLEEGSDLQDLSGPELDQLIQRLKATSGEKA